MERGGVPALRVATWNVYLGADLTAITAARDESALTDAATTAMRQAERTRFPERAKVIAEVISKSRPDVLGLQEIGRWEVEDHGRRRVLWNHAALVADALDNLGAPYILLHRNDTFEADLRLDDGRTAGFANCDAVLVRAEPDRPITVVDAGFGHFEAHVELTTGGETRPVRRGWVQADLEVGGRRVRVLTTHLASLDADVRHRQARELLTVAGDSPYPVVLVGDLNAEPGDPAVDALTDAGYQDAWSAAGSGPGATWGRSADLDGDGELRSRIDYVFVGPERLQVETVDLIGADHGARTGGTPGLWASDHAGVLAEIGLA